jgi:hypothetical protein
VKATDQFEIVRAWIVSTVHIREQDSRVLSQVPDLTVCEYQEGFWIAVPDAEEFRVMRLLERLQEAGLSSAVGHILSVASGQAVEYVKLDSDGPVYDFLPQFHW